MGIRQLDRVSNDKLDSVPILVPQTLQVVVLEMSLLVQRQEIGMFEVATGSWSDLAEPGGLESKRVEAETLSDVQGEVVLQVVREEFVSEEAASSRYGGL